MLDLKFVRENLPAVAAALKKRGFDFDVEAFEGVDAGRRAAITEAEQLKAAKNGLSKKIGELKKAGEDAGELMDRVRLMGQQVSAAEARAAELDDKLYDGLKRTPNLPHESVPVGLSPDENVQVKAWGTPPTFGFTPKPHWELGEALGILDWVRATKISGARFTVYRGMGARLERALIQFMLDTQTLRNGYTEFWTPLLVNAETMFGTGQLPKFEEDLFRLRGDSPYYLIPTAEVPLTNLHRDEILDEAVLPLKYTAYTPCFRAEAGSYGKDTKGMVRQHQFNKVELVKFALPEDSFAEHEALTLDAESILEALELPYRRMLLCAGDMGFGAAKCYDLEVYSAGQEKRWWECSSCSNFTDFQARRANIKVKRRDGKKELLHTLNGSGLATSRVLPAILENNQLADGSIVIPKVLRPYLGGIEKIG
ncbi:MAG TPA: serine--tRNA ligase [bacterium]|jgi:seryl-tRNA synthetase|nr:serine--tRNA ligase [bacterium]